jgi:L-2,4-diaminobutyrate decarboxylase
VDQEFVIDQAALVHALDLMRRKYTDAGTLDLGAALPESGLGSRPALDALAPVIIGRAAALGAPSAFAHMDPPTPWLSWAMTLWNASLNQNLLHAATAPAAREIEERVVAWLAPYFGMSGGHVTPGSTLANLTALWAARECTGVTDVIAAEGAHVSVPKAAHLLGLEYRVVPSSPDGALLPDRLPRDLSKSALVLTAGTTSAGAIDRLDLAGRAAWTHVDAAWAGPLRLTKYAARLGGVEHADSVSVSAHKWLFQPKESALVLFRDSAKAHAGISFGAAYLATPNVGILGSHGAAAVPLLAVLLAWGRQGIAARIEACMDLAMRLAQFIEESAQLELFRPPQTGIVLWRPRELAAFDTILRRLPLGSASTTAIGGGRWLRCVAANPNADIDLLTTAIAHAVNSEAS